DKRHEPTSIVDGRWPRFVDGGPDRVRATLEQMMDGSGADELMVQDLIADPEARRRPHGLLAEAFGAARRGWSAGAAAGDRWGRSLRLNPPGRCVAWSHDRS